MADLHRDPRVGPRLHEIVSAAGFRDVQVQYIRLAMGGWDPSAYSYISQLLARRLFVLVKSRGPLSCVSKRADQVNVHPADATCTDPTQAGIGRDAVGVVGDLLESLGLWPFTTYLGWTAAQFDYLIHEVRLELQNTELQLYLPM